MPTASFPISAPTAAGAVLILLGALSTLLYLRGRNRDRAGAYRRRRLAEFGGETPQSWKERQALRSAREELHSRKAAAAQPGRVGWRRMKWVEGLERQLSAAGGNRVLPVAAGMALAAAATLAGASIHMFGMGVVPALALGAAAAPLVAHMTIHSRIARRRREFLELLPEAIDLIVRSVRAGIPVSTAISLVGTEVAEPVGGEFQRLSDALSIGVDFKEALERAADRILLPDFDFFVVCLGIQRETGGQLAETLMNLSEILRRRKEVRRKLKALTAEGRTSAKIVGAIPLVAGLGLFAINPNYTRRLLDDPTGNQLLLVSVVSVSLGMFVINRMTRSPE